MQIPVLGSKTSAAPVEAGKARLFIQQTSVDYQVHARYCA